MEGILKASKVAVPAVEFELIHWQRAGELSRRQELASRGKYKSSIPSLIAGVQLSIPDELAAEIEDATAALVRFDQEEALTSAPLSAVLLQSESASSSQVELLNASSKQIGLAQLGLSGSSSASLIVDNVQAMQAAANLASNPSKSAIVEMHRVLLERSNPKIVGSFRSRAVWIGGSSPHVAKFVGPEPVRIDALMDDLIEFINRTDLPRLAQIAIAHAQFETIHPFEDGNGRTGRTLIHSMLRSSGISTNSIAPISAGLLQDVNGYFSALTQYRTGDAGPIISSITGSSLHAVTVGRELMKRLRHLQTELWGSLRLRSGSVAHRLIEHLPEYPALNSKKVQELLGVSEPAAIGGLRALELQGVLTQNSTAKRSRVWLCPSVLEIWSSFAPTRALN
jgi:Fic family protein